MAKETVGLRCNECNQVVEILLDSNDVEKWTNGGQLIQHALDYLTVGEREMLMSRTCDVCFKKIFSEDEEMEEGTNE